MTRILGEGQGSSEHVQDRLSELWRSFDAWPPRVETRLLVLIQSRAEAEASLHSRALLQVLGCWREVFSCPGGT
jgi:hypothetical protein